VSLTQISENNLKNLLVDFVPKKYNWSLSSIKVSENLAQMFTDP